jgi:hypothetical protein
MSRSEMENPMLKSSVVSALLVLSLLAPAAGAEPLRRDEQHQKQETRGRQEKRERQEKQERGKEREEPRREGPRDEKERWRGAPEGVKKEREGRAKTRGGRQQKERQALEKQWGGLLEHTAARKELALHAERLARATYLDGLARAANRADLVARVAAVRAKEMSRHATAMARLQREAP